MVLVEVIVKYVELTFVFHRLVAVEAALPEDLAEDQDITEDPQEQETQEVIVHQKEMPAVLDNQMALQEAEEAQAALDNPALEITKAEQV